jgi:hypothetical protein
MSVPANAEDFAPQVEDSDDDLMEGRKMLDKGRKWIVN